MAEQTDVRLIIQARDEASKKLKELVDVTQALVDENKKLTDSGKKTDAALQSLRENYKQLADAAEKLKQAKALADNFEKQAAAAKQAKAAVEANEQSLRDVSNRQKKAAAAADEHAASLEKARTKVKSQTSLISRYRKQLADLTASEKDETKAIAELNQKLEQAQQKQADARRERQRLTDAKKEAAAEERKLTSEANRLNKALEKQRVTVANANNAQKQAGQAAKEAGIDTNRLADEQNRLQKELEQTEASLNEARQRTRDYSQAMRTAGNETRRTAKDTDRFGNASRKSMSIAQRARGQVLSLVAAYVGLYGAIDQVTQSFQSYFKAQSAAARLATQFGEDQQALQQELDYVSYLADRLGRDMETLETSYSQFFVVSKELGNTTEETRGLFTMLSEASTAMKLTADDFDGAMRAITQIMSKGQVMAEELRGQLGERLPGAVSLMAKAFDVSEQKLNKMMEQGELTAEALFGFSVTVREEFGKGLPKAMNTFQAAWNRLQNAVTRNRRLFAGAAEGQLREAIERLTQFLNSEQAGQAIVAMANGFASLINALVTLTQYTEELKALFQFIFVTWGLKAVYNMGVAFVDLTNNMRRATTRVEKFGRALRISLIIPGLIMGGISLWKKYGDGIKKVFEEDIPGIMERAQRGILLNFKILGRKIVIYFKEAAQSIAESLAGLADSVGLTKLASGLRDIVSAESLGLGSDRSQLADMEARLAEMRANQARAFADAWNKILRNAKSGNADDSGMEALYQEGLERAKERARQAALEAEAKRKIAEAARQQAKEEKDAAKLKKDLYAIETKLLKERAKSIKDQKALVDRELMDITDRLIMAGDLAGLEIVEQYRQMKYEAIETADAKEKERQAEEHLNTLMQQRRDIVEYIKMLQDSGRIEDESALESMRKALAEINGELTGAIDKMIKLAEAANNTALVAKLKAMKLSLEDVNNETLQFGQQLNEQIAQRGSQAFMEIGEAMGEFIMQGGSLSDVFRSAGDAFRKFAADTLKWLAQLIMRFVILKAVQGSFGGTGFGGFVEGMLGAGTNHTGGLAGSGGKTRQVSPGWFSNAKRYHTGGVAGLKPDEVPTILQRGEEVLTRTDPRHRFNGGGGAAQGKDRIQIINAIDSEDVVQKGLTSGRGTKTVLNMIRTNRSEIKQILGN